MAFSGRAWTFRVLTSSPSQRELYRKGRHFAFLSDLASLLFSIQEKDFVGRFPGFYFLGGHPNQREDYSKTPISIRGGQKGIV